MGWKDRLDPIKQSLLSNAVGSDFIAVHMAWGAANEWSAIAAYNRLADLESHPVLSELLRRIARQEAKHVAFYASQARDRLAASKKAQVIARFALSRFWGPVGSGIETDDEVVHVLSHLMGNEEGLVEVRKIDTNISKMPGLEGLEDRGDRARQARRPRFHRAGEGQARRVGSPSIGAMRTPSAAGRLVAVAPARSDRMR